MKPKVSERETGLLGTRLRSKPQSPGAPHGPSPWRSGREEVTARPGITLRAAPAPRTVSGETVKI